MKRISLFTLFFLCLAFADFGAQNKIKVLILSGRNNHDWKATTPYLQKMYEESDLFEVEITEKPDTLNTNDFQKFDVVVSNWSSFPDKEYRWPTETEHALIDFIKSGGGFVTVHAATTCFYEWPEFKNISTGAWINGTKHGKQCAAEVKFQETKHPVTKGMADFIIFEELWENAEQNPGFEVLATAKNENTIKNGNGEQAVVMVKEYGKGRIFHTTLGHDTRQMRNVGFQTLVLRGTEWATSGKVKQEIPQELQVKAEAKARYKWAETDSTITLLKGKNVQWQYNFREFHQKPHFNPVFVGRSNITCVSPDDHHWHAGQWFSWKYINGVNYWEYVNKKEYRSEGITEIKDIHFVKNPDFSAEIILDIVYHPAGSKENVLAETRTIKIAAPNSSGRVSMDYQFEFKAVAENVELNRTPIEGETNGKSWGGYGGLSLRLSQNFMEPETIFSGNDGEIHGKKGNWLYMELTGIDGNRVGSQIIISPNTIREESAWYLTNTEKFPFYYFSPAHLFYKPIQLKKGEKLVLNYRINHFANGKTKPELEKEYQNYKNQ